MTTVRLRNINPLGRVDLPLIGREGELEGEGFDCLEPGEEFQVSPEHAAILLQQASNYEPADAAAVEIDSQIEANAFRHQKKRAPAKKAPPAKRAPAKKAPAKAAAPAAGSDTAKGDA